MKTDLIFKYGFFAMIALVIIVYMFKGIPGDTKAYIKSLEEEKKELNEKVSRLEGEIRNIITELEIKNDSLRLEQEVSEEWRNKRLAAIKYYEKRIKARDNLATHQLDSIFAERYGFSSSPSEESSN